MIGGPAQPFETQGSALALETAAPDSGSTAAVLAANPIIAAAFGAAPTFFAIDEMGGAYAKSGGTTSQTNTDDIDLTVDLTKLSPEGDLILGFYGGTALGAGFTSMTLSITADGAASPQFSQTFTTVASALAFFSDTTQDLGTLGAGSLSGNTLSLQIQMTITTTAGEGFAGQIIVGDPPGAASSPSRFAQHIAGLGGGIGGSALPASSGVSPPQPMLAMSRMAAFA